MITKPYKVISGLGAGAGAALAMLGVMALLRMLFGFLTLPELMLNPILKVMGGQAFSDALDRLYYAGRPLLFASILEGILLVGALLGLLYSLFARPDPLTGRRLALFNPPWGGILYGLLLGVLLNIVFLPLVGQPLFADKPAGLYAPTFLPLWLGLIILTLVFGLVLQALLPSAASSLSGFDSDSFDIPQNGGRRTFLQVMGGALLAVAGGGVFTLGGTIINQGGLTSPVNNKNLEVAGASDPPDPPAASTPHSTMTSTRQAATATSTRPPAATSTLTPTTSATSSATAIPPEQPSPTATQAPTQVPPTEPLPTSTPQPAPTDTPIPTVPTVPTVPPPTATSTSNPVPSPTNTPLPAIKVSEITPVQSFYHVSKNFFDPSPLEGTWRLQVMGMVNKPYTLTYADLKALPSVDVVVGMMCISNPIGGGLIGNTTWKGVRLADLLNRAVPQKGAYKVAMTAEDGYTDSITLQKALDPDVVLVWEMGGVPLTPEHGFPARLMVPGIYGMKHVKWLNTIELVSYDFKGYWQQPEQGWSDPAPVNIMSKIDYPDAGVLKMGQQHTLSGVAFAGDRSISKVEVSTDNGKTWAEAYVRPRLSGTSWVVWAFLWTPPAPGKYTARVRATDGKGNLQTQKVRDPYPNGATGWHAVGYTVR